MITKYHNHENGYIALVNVSVTGIPDRIVISGKELTKKSEFHISLVATKHLSVIIVPEHVDKEARQLETYFLDFAKQNDLTKFSFTGEFRVVSKAERLSVVAMVKLRNTTALFKYLEQQSNTRLPVQPTHVTLYTLQQDVGIGILSYDELAKISEDIELPVLENIRIGST